jgi:PEP-CTERM motif-containing protein
VLHLVSKYCALFYIVPAIYIRKKGDEMKNATLVVLSIAAFVGLVSMASATPLGVSEIAKTDEVNVSEGAKNHGATVSEFAKHHGSTVNQAAKNGGFTSLSYQGITSVQSIPEPSTLLLLGVGFVALVVWQHRSRRGMAV